MSGRGSSSGAAAAAKGGAPATPARSGAAPGGASVPVSADRQWPQVLVLQRQQQRQRKNVAPGDNLTLAPASLTALVKPDTATHGRGADASQTRRASQR